MTSLIPRTLFQPGTTFHRRTEERTAAVPPASLAEAVRAAVHEVEGETLRPPARAGSGMAYQSRSLLALLTYHYARGVLSSSEIEGALWRDRQLRELSGQDVPSARVLRRFRRDNRETLRRCLMGGLAYLAASMASDGPAGARSENALAEEATRRIANAMFIDQMELTEAEF